MSAPPRSISAATSEPFHSGGISARIRNQVVSHAPPHALADGERLVLTAPRLGDRDRLAVHVVRLHVERDPVAVDRGLHEPFQHPVDLLAAAARDRRAPARSYANASDRAKLTPP